MNVFAVRLLSILVGYAFGLFQTAYFVGKAHGVDIRTLGSGNAGTTNALRNFGKRAGLIVFCGDVLKSVFAALCVYLIFESQFPDIIRLLCVYAGAGAMLGHCFPIYMEFRGGKGVACLGGLVIAFSWQLAILGIAVFLGLIAITHYVSLGSLLGSLSFFVGTLVMGQMGLFGMPAAALIEMYTVIFLLVALVWFQHRSNIVRLISGNERKTYLFSTREKK